MAPRFEIPKLESTLEMEERLNGWWIWALQSAFRRALQWLPWSSGMRILLERRRSKFSTKSLDGNSKEDFSWERCRLVPGSAKFPVSFPAKRIPSNPVKGIRKGKRWELPKKNPPGQLLWKKIHELTESFWRFSHLEIKYLNMPRFVIACKPETAARGTACLHTKSELTSPTADQLLGIKHYIRIWQAWLVDVTK